RGHHCPLAWPGKTAPIFVYDVGIDVEEFCFQVVEVRIIEIELPFQCPIADPPSILEDCDRLLKHLFKGHDASLSPARDASDRPGDCAVAPTRCILVLLQSYISVGVRRPLRSFVAATQ